MEYLWAILIFGVIFALTTILTGILGSLIPLTYALLGFILGAESLIMGLGGLIGSIINYYNANRYIRTQGAMSNAPRYSMLSSVGFVLVFIGTVILKFAFKVEVGNFNYWYFLIFAIVAWIALNLIFKNHRANSLSNIKQSVIKFKVLRKYDDDPKWATYLYFINGEEAWNKTIPGSFLAKNPENDLTFVHYTKEDAIEYAKSFFNNAEYIDE